MLLLVLYVCFAIYISQTWATNLATITPCAVCPPNLGPTPITVSEQYQTVSTCSDVKSICFRNRCKLDVKCSEYPFVSTIISYLSDGTSPTSTIITSIDQTVTASVKVETFTSRLPIGREGNFGFKKSRGKPVYRTLSREHCVNYVDLGPLALPGYSGSGLCKKCFPNSRTIYQDFQVTECLSGWGLASPECITFDERWEVFNPPTTTVTQVVPCETSFFAPTDGTYTLTFPQHPQPTVLSSAGETWSIAPPPWNVYITTIYRGSGSTIHISKTVTKTVTWVGTQTTRLSRAYVYFLTVIAGLSD